MGGKRILGALFAGALILAASGARAANPRIALVIGESAYADATLPTTANDAGLIAQVLQAAGFDVVGARDLDQKSVREAMRDFLDKANAAGPDMQAFVYFSGRAVQFEGDDYLAPIDARIARASDAPIEAVKLADFTHALAAAPGLARVVVIDGARTNPYAAQGEPLAGGLALITPEPNTVLAYNAAPGAIGVEDVGDYGVYAKTLAGLLRQGGVDIRDVLDETRLAVNQATQGAEIPWNAGKLNAPYFIFERAADAAPVVVRRPPPRSAMKTLSAEEAYEVAVERDSFEGYEDFLRAHAKSPQARRVEAILAARREALFWRHARQGDSPRAYWTYLRRYPHGPHVYDAELRLDALAARREPPRDFEAVEYDDLPPPPPDEVEFADRPYYYFGGDDFGPPPPPPPPDYVVEFDDGWRDLPPPPPPTIVGLLPALAIAIPLALTVRAYSGRPRADGLAPASAPPPAERPFAPPPLPAGVQPTAPRSPPPQRPASAAVAPGAQPVAPGPGTRFVAPTAPGAATAALHAPPPGGAPASPAPNRTPLPAPAGAAPPPAAPLASPAPGAVRAPPPAGATPPAPAPNRTPLPTPAGAAPPPAAPLASPAPGAVRTPPPAPGAPLAPAPNRTALPAAKPLAPLPSASPSPAPSRTPAPGAGGAPSPSPVPLAPRPTPEARPRATEAPRPEAAPARPAPPRPEAAPARPVEAPRPAAAPRPEPVAPPPPRPAPKVERPAAPPPAPEAPKPRAEAPPRPAPEAPRPAPPPQPAKPPPPEPAKAACGHPGQPKC